MDNCKYIVFDEVDNDDYVMILFPSFIEHSKIANRFKNSTPMSAGYIDLESKTVYGESKTLNLKPQVELDTFVLRHLFDGKY